MNDKKHILLVEDDRRLVGLIRDYLEQQAFEVSIVERGDIAVPLIIECQPDLVVLDIMLPGKDGLSVCKEVRHLYDGPILMLTAREKDSDEIEGLEIGADDYVKKPIEPRVLLARIRALLRRFSSSVQANVATTDTIIEFGALRICLSSRRVMLGDEQIELTSAEYDLLLILAQSAGTTLDREHLFKTLRGVAYDGLDRTMDVSVSRLRKKLGDSSTRPFRIKTVWGQGYLFVPDAWY